jgi:hypothetical protein
VPDRKIVICRAAHPAFGTYEIWSGRFLVARSMPIGILKPLTPDIVAEDFEFNEIVL